MKQQIKKGESPTKPSVNEAASTNSFIAELQNQPSLTDIPKHCKEELASKNLEARWIDVVLLKKNQGHHKRNWQPYKFECLKSGGKHANPFSTMEGQYEGYLMRQQMILAVKSVEEAQKRRDFIKTRTKMQSNPTKAAFKAFKEEFGGAMKVTGDDDEGDGNE